MKELKEMVRQANEKLSKGLKTDEELRKNQEEMRKALGMQHATVEQLKEEMKTISSKMDEITLKLDGLEVRLSKMDALMERMAKTTYDLFETELLNELDAYELLSLDREFFHVRSSFIVTSVQTSTNTLFTSSAFGTESGMAKKLPFFVPSSHSVLVLEGIRPVLEWG